MKRLILILVLFGSTPTWADTPFYINNNAGDNLNSGHTTEATATFTSTSGNWTNDTSATIGTFYKSGLGAAATAVTNGAFASVYPDATTMATPFVGMVVTNDATQDTIQVSLVAKGGTKPPSSVGGTTIKVGGAWLGPGMYEAVAASPTNTFPFGILHKDMTNTTGTIHVWIKGGTPYSVTNSLIVGNAGPGWIQGYTTTPGDGGKATIYGGTTATAFNLFTTSLSGWCVADLIFDHNGASGNGIGVNATGIFLYRCVISRMNRAGLSTASASYIVECEMWGNNTNSASGNGGIVSGGADIIKRTISRHNAGSGFVNTIGHYINCTAYGNAGAGAAGGSSFSVFSGCNFYNNGSYGIDCTRSSLAGFSIENCNIFKNGNWGINSSGGTFRYGDINTCWFGSGTMANANGAISTNITISAQGGIVTNAIQFYTANDTPWVDPDNGNFTEKSTALTKASGRGSFYQSAVNPPTNTVSYPDVGATQSASTNSSSGEHSHVFAQ